MKKHTLHSLYLFIFFNIFSLQIHASHLMGGEITWQCQGAGQYVFTLKLYRDCNGISQSTVAQTLRVHNNPLISGITVNFISQTDISPSCGSGGPNITCAGGGAGAVSEYVFRSNPILLSGVPPSQGWVFTFTDCCRNGSISNLTNPSSQGITLRAIMYPLNGMDASTCYDSSPTFTQRPTSIVCTGNSFTYNQNASDVNYDSLVYNWGQPLNQLSGNFTSTNPSALNFNTGYAFNSPFPNTNLHPSNIPATLDPQTGEIEFTSYTQGNFVTCIKVSSYRCGVLVAEIFREIQLLVTNCPSNANPTVVPPFQDQFGNYTQFADTVMAGDLVTFNFSGSDSPSQTIYLTANGLQFGTNYANPNSGCDSPPCATLGPPPLPEISGSGNVFTNFYWQTNCNHLSSVGNCSSVSNTYQFLFTIHDNFCPTAGYTIKTVSITVLSSPAISSPNLHCISIDEPSGNATLSWDQPIDTLQSFTAYNIYSSTNYGGPYNHIGTVSDYNTLSFTDINANANQQTVFYYVTSKSGCNGVYESSPKDTLQSLFLQSNFTTNNNALNWNAMHNPGLASASSWYQLYKRTNNGAWFFIDSTQSLNYLDTLSSCGETVDYYITLADTLPCSSQSNFTRLSPIDTFYTAINSSFLCLGDSTELLIDSSFLLLTFDSISWELGNNSFSQNLYQTLVYDSAQSYIINFWGKFDSSCFVLGTDTIAISEYPVLTLSNDTTICLGDSVSLNAQHNGNSFFWFESNFISDTSSSTPTVWPSANQTYFGQSINALCASTDSIVVVVQQLPLITISGDSAVCSSDSTEITVSSDAPFLLSGNLSLNDSSATNFFVQSSTNYWIIATATDSIGCYFGDTLNVNVTPTPVLTVSPDTTICFGQSIQIMASSNFPHLWNIVDTAQSSSQDTIIVTPQSNINIVATASNQFCYISDSVMIEVLSIPSLTVSQDTAVCPNQQVVLTAFASATISWQSIHALPSYNTDSLVFVPDSSLTAIVIATDSNLCSASDTIEVQINTPPSLNILLDTAICFGDSLQLIGVSNSTITWYSISDTILQSSPVVQPLVSSYYTATAVDSNNCHTSDSVFVIVNSLPFLNHFPDTSVCFGNNIMLSANSNGTVNWFLEDSIIANNAIYTVISDNVFSVISIDSNYCSTSDSLAINALQLPVVDAGQDFWSCPGSNFTLNGSSNSVNWWAPGIALTDSTLATTVGSVNDTTIFVLFNSDSLGCISSDTLTVYANNDLYVDAGKDTIYCIYDSITLGGSPSANIPVSYIWINGSDTISNLSNPMVQLSSSGYFVLRIEHDACWAQDSIYITANQIQIPTYADTALCIGDSIRLSATGGVNYYWSGNNPIEAPDQPTTYITGIQTGSVSLLITDSLNCIDSTSFALLVHDYPTISFSGTDTVCAGIQTQLTIQSGDSALWLNPLLADSIVNNTAFINPSNTMWLSGLAINSINCITQDSIRITVLPLPLISAGEDFWVCPGANFQLDGTTSATGWWSPGDVLADSNQVATTGSITDSTHFVLHAIDSFGCRNSDTILAVANKFVPVNAGIDEVICPGSFMSLGGSPTSLNSSSFFWTSNNGFTSNASNPDIYAISSDVYYLHVTNDTCHNYDTVAVMVHQLDWQMDSLLSGCVFDTLNLNLAGVENVSWSTLNNIISESDSLLQISGQISEFLFLNGHDINGCEIVDSTQIVIFDLPNIDLNYENNNCSGDTISIWANGAYTYEWTSSNPLILIDSNTIQVLAAGSGTTLVNISDGNGCKNDSLLFHTVYPLPSISIFGDSAACEGETISLSAVGAQYYSWWLNDSLLSVTSHLTYTPLENGVTTVVAKDSNGCQNMDSAHFYFNAYPFFEFQLTHEFNCNGALFTLATSTHESTVWTQNEEILDENLMQINFNSTAILSASVSQNQCTTTKDTVISVLDIHDYTHVEIPNIFTPNQDGTNDYYNILVEQPFVSCSKYKIFNRWGQEIYNTGIKTGWDGTIAGKPASEGIYYIIVEFGGKHYNSSFYLMR